MNDGKPILLEKHDQEVIKLQHATKNYYISDNDNSLIDEEGKKVATILSQDDKTFFITIK
ncbi:hypothetical protein N9C35_04920 [Flavobacteriaceae bacterium]|nr:hypothetical protein [Flavobacteriaceae bacterium]